MFVINLCGDGVGVVCVRLVCLRYGEVFFCASFFCAMYAKMAAFSFCWFASDVEVRERSSLRARFLSGGFNGHDVDVYYTRSVFVEVRLYSSPVCVLVCLFVFFSVNVCGPQEICPLFFCFDTPFCRCFCLSASLTVCPSVHYSLSVSRCFLPPPFSVLFSLCSCPSLCFSLSLSLSSLLFCRSG